MGDFSILVVDDQQIQRDTLAEILRGHSFSVKTARDFPEACQLLDAQIFDIILTDFKMPTGSGLDVAKYAMGLCPESVVFIMTAYADVTSVIEAMQLGVMDYLLKPLNVNSLLNRIKILKDRRELKTEVEYLRQELNRRFPKDLLLGNSTAIQQIRQTIEKVSSTKGSVLITGESGTGKEVVARLIHAMSSSAKDKFVAINCGAIPEQLMESELFGHTKGAFSGAIAERIGLFSIANGGTVFLDEIGEMPKALQVKLLRVLQEREFIPVGGTQIKKVDVRIIAATNKDLTKEIQEGHFRSDLFYRLNVIEINLPPLRQRTEDIPLLATYFVQKYSQELSSNIHNISNQAMRKLMTYNWPGNIRELENVIERAIILSQGAEIIGVESLPPSLQLTSAEDTPTMLNLDDAIKYFTRCHIIKTMDILGGDKKKVAEVLGVSLSSLYRKMEELSIATKKDE